MATHSRGVYNESQRQEHQALDRQDGFTGIGKNQVCNHCIDGRFSASAMIGIGHTPSRLLLMEDSAQRGAVLAAYSTPDQVVPYTP